MSKENWNFNKISKQLLANIGGVSNINDIYHCATRLRIVVKDTSLVNENNIKKIDGILGVMIKGNEVQNVIGQQVDEYYNGVISKINFKKNDSTKNNMNQSKSDSAFTNKKLSIKNILSIILDFISGVVLPVMPVFVGAGFLMALLNLAKTFFNLNPNGGTATVLSAISSSGFFFLPVFVGFYAANKMKIPGAMGAFLGAILTSSTINSVTGLSFLGLHVAKTQYNGTVLPAILGVIVLAFLYRALNHYLPKEITYFFTPLISIVITIPIVILVIGPISNTISNALAAGFALLSAKANWLAFALYSALNPILVMFGIDKGFIPIVINNMSKMGYDTLIYPAAMTSNPAMGAAALAVALQSHKLKTRGEGFSAGITGILGITEPSIFGFLLPYRRALFGAIGGLVGGIFQVKQGALMSPGLISLVSYFVGKNPTANFTFAVIALIVSVISGFTITTILIRTDTNRMENNLFIADRSNNSTLITSQNAGKSATQEQLYAPTSGTLNPLSKVSDDLIADKTLGDGFAIEPSTDQILSPVGGTISTIFPTKHAIGITTPTGLEVLLHLGIDTVNLAGAPFTLTIHNGDKVNAGDNVAKMDLQQIKKAGKQTTVIVLITNMNKVKSIQPIISRNVSKNEKIAMVNLT
ncbi:glucose PTS transporter subunit IIA [Pediococcus siamensis]|uniref:glucose PTS transporter subunit IIA n=1 Tax=Pediococcus siamensis TaxID=381829 RepID=UPI0039A26D86